MTLAEAILAALVKLPPDRTDKTELPAARLERLTVAAGSVATACGQSVPCVAALLAIGTAETHWAGYVGRAECHLGPFGQRCDPDHAGRARAFGYFQIWNSKNAACTTAHNEAQPLAERHAAAAVCARDHWRAAVSSCKGDLAGAVRHYHRGACFMSPSESPKYSGDMAGRVAAIGLFSAKLLATGWRPAR